MKQVEGKKGVAAIVYWCVVSVGMAVLISLKLVFAAEIDIWTRVSNIMRELYGEMVAISTIIAVTVASVALIIRMVSRNQRAVDEATAWLKRIVFTWLIINSLGFLVGFLQPLIAGGNYTP